MENMSNQSLSKKWRLAVKENLFEGSFKEFAEMYNENFELNNSEADDEHFSDDATKFGNPTKAESDTTVADLKRIEKDKLEQPKIMGMSKPTFIFVASSITVVTAVGLYLLVNKLGKKNSQ
jgi:hypothetical protein